MEDDRGGPTDQSTIGRRRFSLESRQSEMEAGRQRFQKACKELDDRLTLRELRRDWFTLLGVISIGIVIGLIGTAAIILKFR